VLEGSLRGSKVVGTLRKGRDLGKGKDGLPCENQEKNQEVPRGEGKESALVVLHEENWGRKRGVHRGRIVVKDGFKATVLLPTGKKGEKCCIRR